MTYEEGIEWLGSLAAGTSSTELDNARVQALLRKIGFPRAVVVLGAVYHQGRGRPDSIHAASRWIKEAMEERVREADSAREPQKGV